MVDRLGYTKFNETKLGADLLGYIIEQVEEIAPKNMNWVESIERIPNKGWRFTIKHVSNYFPLCIKKYVSHTKKMSLEGSLWEIEEQLTDIYKNRR